MVEEISPSEFQEAEGVEDWRVVSDGATACFRAESFRAGARLVEAISELPEIDDHSPDIDLRSDGVTVRLVTVTDRYYGMSRGDIAIARRVSRIARDLGLSADPSAVQSVLIVPGASETGAIRPFWQAVLGYEPRPDSPDEDLVDPPQSRASVLA
jgi:4a-hydroxytetrahydrobiopterin dehydratase